MTDRDVYMVAMGRVFRWIREARKRTQAEIEKDSGLPQSTLSRFENGTHVPDLHQAEALAMPLSLPTDRLVELVERAVCDLRGRLVYTKAGIKGTRAELEAHATLAVASVLQRRPSGWRADPTLASARKRL